MAGKYIYGRILKIYHDTDPDMAGDHPLYQVYFPPFVAVLREKETEKNDGANGHRP